MATGKTIDDLYDLFDNYFNNGGTLGRGSGSSHGGRYTTSHQILDDVSFNDALEEARARRENRESGFFDFTKYRNLKEYVNELQQDIEDLQQKRLNATTDEERLEIEEEINEKYRERLEIMGRIDDMGGDGVAGYFKRGLNDINKATNALSQTYREIRSLAEPWAKVDTAASKYAKTIGMTKTAMDNLSSDSINNVVQGKLAAKYNLSTQELIEAQGNYLKAAGRNIRISNSEQESIAALRAIGGNSNELAALFDNFGVNIDETANRVGEMFSDATKEGLSFEKYSDNVAKNIKIAQNYTFKNGLKGLESMAKKATAMKLDMQQVAQLAEKVSSVEGAIDVSAQLQVLGGPFAQLADPLGMLNEGLNDMEGLQDRLIKMIGGLGKFNKDTGEVAVSAFNKQRIKAAANAMGVSYDSLMESVNAQARRNEISKQIESSIVASGFDDEMKELIKNSGTIKDGQAGVSIRGQFKSLNELSGKDYEDLKTESRSDTDNIKDIAINLRSLVDVEEGRKKQTEARQAQFYKQMGRAMKRITGMLATIGLIHNILLVIQATQTIGSIGNIWRGFGRGGARRAAGAANRMASGAANRMASGAANRMTSGTTNRMLSNIFKGRVNTPTSISTVLPAGTKLNKVGRIIDTKTGRFISSQGAKTVADITSNGAKKSIAKRVTSGTILNNVTEVFKNGAKRVFGDSVVNVYKKQGLKQASKKVFENGAKRVFGDSAVNVYKKQGIKKASKKVFENGTKRVFGNSAVNVYKKEGLKQASKKVFENGAKRAFGNSVVNAYKKEGLKQASKKIFENSAKKVFGNSAVNIYKKEGLKQASKKVFENGAKRVFGNSAVNVYKKQGLKQASKKVFENGAKRVFGNSVVNVYKKEGLKQASKKAFSNLTTKGVAKTAATKGIATTAGKAALAGVSAVSTGLGIVGLVGDLVTDSMVRKGKMKKGGTAHHAAKAASGAASGAGIGMLIGSIFPGIGTAIGGAVGAVVGAGVGMLKANKAKQEVKLEKTLEKSGITMQGKYKRRGLENLNWAMESGRISNRMRKKLEKKGDFELLDKIDSIAADKTARGEKLKKRKFFDTDLGRAMMWLNPSLGAAVLGARGVKSLVGKSNSISQGKKSKRSAAEILKSHNTDIRPVLEKGMNTKYGSVNKKSNTNEVHLKSDPQNININGTLNLRGQDGKQMNIIDTLKRDPHQVAELTSMLTARQKYVEHAVNRVEKP